MASSVFPRFLRNQSHSAKRIVPLLNKQITYEPPSLHTSPMLAHMVESDNRPFRSSSFAQFDLAQGPCQLYPKFSAGLFIKSFSSPGLIGHDVFYDAFGYSPTIRADSVKRKMNKHKLRNLTRRWRKT